MEGDEEERRHGWINMQMVHMVTESIDVVLLW